MQLVATFTRQHGRIGTAAGAIERISQQRRTDGCGVDSDLMGAACGNREIHQAGI
jgi:hypothetical protein